MLFSCGRGMYVWENCTEGNKSGWHNKPPPDWAPPPSKQCKHGEAAAHSSAFFSEKLRNSTLTPQYRAEQFPNDLYLSGQLLLCKSCQHSVDWKCKNEHILSKSHEGSVLFVTSVNLSEFLFTVIYIKNIGFGSKIRVKGKKTEFGKKI